MKSCTGKAASRSLVLLKPRLQVGRFPVSTAQSLEHIGAGTQYKVCMALRCGQLLEAPGRLGWAVSSVLHDCYTGHSPRAPGFGKEQINRKYERQGEPGPVAQARKMREQCVNFLDLLWRGFSGTGARAHACPEGPNQALNRTPTLRHFRPLNPRQQLNSESRPCFLSLSLSPSLFPPGIRRVKPISTRKPVMAWRCHLWTRLPGQNQPSRQA